jgi:tetratricopeptide (TPR) repeat protein
VRLLPFALLLACAEQRLPPTFPEQAAGRPVIAEQAILGLSDAGSAAVAQLIDAEGARPELTLSLLDGAGGPSHAVLTAPERAARAVAQRVRGAGHRPTPILAAALVSDWPEAAARAAELGFIPRPPAAPEPGRRRWLVSGAAENGSLPLALRLAESGSDPRALLLLLSERAAGEAAGDEIELTRMTLAGAAVAPELWIQNGVAWLLSGSALPGEPLHRAVGVRRGSLVRGEAQLHNAHGLADYAAGDLDAARREFDRAIAADPRFADGLYNAAATAALSDHTEEAVAFLRRAAAIDPDRVQVLGRNDDDLRSLRRRADVRAILGLRRPPPENLPAPP